ncbi:CHAD domain-containing protein [Salipiger sp. H15]|uniref:CHAD domain-containing protein n=1 Tax=Alloyangia sp. H15 TaxID=3029062 RepID=A0AAU8AGZ2_9RHOB
MAGGATGGTCGKAAAGESTLYLLPGGGVEHLLAPLDGALVPHVAWAESSVPFLIRDTFDQALRRSGRVLVETEQGAELIGAGGVVEDGPLAGARFVAGFPEGPVREALSDVSALRCLLPVGAGTLRRGALALLDDEQKTQVRASLLRLDPAEAGGAALLRLEGLRGYDRALVRLRERVVEAGGEPFSAAALLAQLFPQRVPYEPKPVIPLERDTEAFDAAGDIIAAYLPVARANEAGVIADDDTEFLHDYRIALRKIRSVLSLFRHVYGPEQTTELKARFSALMAPTGRLRDLDVYLLERDGFLAMVPEGLQGGLERMFALFAEERAAAQAGLAAHLRSDAYRDEIAALMALFGKRKLLARGSRADRPAYDYACRLIWKRYRRICTIAAGIGPGTPEHEIHELRIHCKKLRYLMEFFAPLFPDKSFRRLLKPLKKLQDNLGLFNDYAVQQKSLQAFVDGLDGRRAGSLQVAQSVGALILVLHERQLAERARVEESFAAFDSAGTRQTFRDLFHGGKK